MFTANINKIDRIARIVLGLLLLSLVFFGPQSKWGLIGIVLIVTAFINFCPLYALLGINTKTK